MWRTLILCSIAVLLMSACTVDENGIRDPVSEAKAQATRTGTETTRKSAEVDLSIKEQTAFAKVEADKAALRLAQTQAEADAYRARVMADAEAEAAKVRMVRQTEVAALVTTAFGYALSAVLVLGAACAAFWVAGLSYSRARNAVLASSYVKIGVEPATLLPPPLVIFDGWLLDTRTGERAALRDPAGVNRLRLAATTHTTDVSIMAQAAERIARQKHPSASQVADQLPTIAASLPVILEVGGAE